MFYEGSICSFGSSTKYFKVKLACALSLAENELCGIACRGSHIEKWAIDASSFKMLHIPIHRLLLAWHMRGK